MSPDLKRLISDAICRSDGLEPTRGMLVYDDGGKSVPAREWYDACAVTLVEKLERHGYRIVRAAA